MAGFFGNVASKVQRAATPKTGFWSSIAQLGQTVAGGVLQYKIGKQQQAQPGSPPYIPIPFPPPYTQSQLPPSGGKAKKATHQPTMVLLLALGVGAFFLFGRK